MNLERVEALAEAVELADGRLDADWVARARHVVVRSRRRLTHGTEATVVALAGATGSGKSTLFNALSGSLVSKAGVRRPTTGSVHASIWGPDGESTQLLDWLEASKRHYLPGRDPDLDGLILLDLPDFDSTTRENRLLVDRLIKLVDALVWVTDPQKYADELFHANYIESLSGYGDVMVFLLNQIDLLEPAAQERCISDLTQLLQRDGLKEPEVLGVSATVGTGLGQVREVLSDVVRRREAMLARIDADLRSVASEVEVDIETGKKLVSKATRSHLVEALASAAGADHVVKAVAQGYRLDAAGTMGWPVTRWLRRFRAHPLRRFRLGTQGRTSLPGPSVVEEAEARMAVRATVDEATGRWGEPWDALARRAVAEHSAPMLDALDQAVSRSVDAGKRPGWWSAVGAVQWLVLAAMIAGLVWLAVLFGLEYFQVPTEIVTPEWEGWPVPTLLAIGGAGLGLVVAAIGRILASIGARRQARRTMKELHKQVEGVAETYVLVPIEEELQAGAELGRLLDIAGGT